MLRPIALAIRRSCPISSSNCSGNAVRNVETRKRQTALAAVLAERM